MRAKKPKEGPKNKGGRPKKDDARREAKAYAFRLMPDEVVAFQREAAKRALPMSTWLRGLGRKAAGLDPK